MPTQPEISRRTILSGSAGLGIAAVASGLSGCSPGQSSPTANESPKGIADVAKKQLGPEAKSSPPYPDDYVGPRARDYQPFHDGSKTFRIVVPQDSERVGDWNTNHFSQWFEKRTGLTVEYQAILTTGTGGETDLTKINAMIAADDLPDAFLGIPFSPAQVSLYGQQGLFVELEDLIETYAPELNQAFADYPELRRDLKSLDGHTYQIKALSDCYHCKASPGRAWVHEDYLDAVGASMPTTTDELRELLRLFKERDPSGTGDMVPLAAGKDNPLDTYFMNSFIQTPEPTANWMVINDGKINFVADKPEWREGLRFLRSLYDDGTLSTSTLTATPEEVLRVGNQGRVGVGRVYYQGVLADITNDEGGIWTKYVALPPVKGPGGVQFSCWSDNLVNATPLVITNRCSNPELLVQWADYQLELTAQCNAYSGEKGESWDWAKKGELGINDEQAVWHAKRYPAPTGESWGLYQVYYLSSGFRGGQYSDPDHPNFEKLLYAATEPYEQYSPPREAQLPKLIFDDTAAAEQVRTQQTIQPYVEQSFAEFCTGKRDINDDGTWQDYIDTLNKMGVSQFVELYQRALEALPE